jgi:tRNA-2-methylthio-N6-dimethylallyladenosine synthase
VPPEVKSERLARLFALVEAQQAEHLAALVGSRQTVLVEGSDASTAGAREGLRWTGRSERNEIVHVAGAAERDLHGRLVDVDVTRAFRHSLEGVVPSEALGALPLRTAAAPAAKKKRALPVVLTE